MRTIEDFFVDRFEALEEEKDSLRAELETLKLRYFGLTNNISRVKDRFEICTGTAINKKWVSMRAAWEGDEDGAYDALRFLFDLKEGDK